MCDPYKGAVDITGLGDDDPGRVDEDELDWVDEDEQGWEEDDIIQASRPRIKNHKKSQARRLHYTQDGDEDDKYLKGESGPVVEKSGLESEGEVVGSESDFEGGGISIVIWSRLRGGLFTAETVCQTQL